MCVEQWKHRRTVSVEGFEAEEFWKDPHLGRLLGKVNGCSVQVPVGSLSSKRGNVRVVSNSSVVTDRIGCAYHKRCVLLPSKDVDECNFEACDIEV